MKSDEFARNPERLKKLTETTNVASVVKNDWLAKNSYVFKFHRVVKYTLFDDLF